MELEAPRNSINYQCSQNAAKFKFYPFNIFHAPLFMLSVSVTLQYSGKA